jgi:hypothetical protein
MALAIIAQEESAKAFVLALVRDGFLPWTDDVQRSLSVHECKQLVTLIMEWLLTVNERRLDERTSETPKHPPSAQERVSLPPDVATAMNIYRHEQIKRLGRRYAERHSDWRGRARKLADGQRDRRKQAALYVCIGDDGSLSSEPATCPEAFTEEVTRAKALLQFAQDVDDNCIFATSEYEQFTTIFSAMFQDHGPDGVPVEPDETFDIGIPGVIGVQKTIIVADIVDVEDTDAV